MRTLISGSLAATILLFLPLVGHGQMAPMTQEECLRAHEESIEMIKKGGPLPPGVKLPSAYCPKFTEEEFERMREEGDQAYQALPECSSSAAVGPPCTTKELKEFRKQLRREQREAREQRQKEKANGKD